jgi:uncharacterized protein
MTTRTLSIPEAIGYEARMREFLLEREAENHLMLGVIGHLAVRLPEPEERRYFWTVQNGVRIVGGAFWTPPFKPVLTRMEREALISLLAMMESTELRLNGVSGPAETAREFSDQWSRATGGRSRRSMDMWIRELTHVVDDSAAAGSFRGAEISDIPWLMKWGVDFHESVGLDEPMDVRQTVSEYVKDRRLFVWAVAGRPVSIAGYAGLTPNGARLNLVYTPPGERNKGYARACVGALCRYILSRVKSRCFLFSDAANPVSNRVYDRLGFRTVCDWALYDFEAQPPLSRTGVQ